MDPYMNIWQMTDNLTDDWSKYWPGTVKAFVGLIRIDGDAYRFMGAPQQAGGPMPPAMQQLSVQVFPTRTQYMFQQSGIALTLTFTTPALIDDIDLLSRPITFISFDIESVDNNGHQVELYFDHTGEIAVNTVDEEIVWSRASSNLVDSMRIGTSAQSYFDITGDGVGIDWGFAYLGVPIDNQASTVMCGALSARNTFASSGMIPTSDDTNMPRAASDNWPVLAASWNLGVVNTTFQSKYVIFGYDEVQSIDYFGQVLTPYWRQNFGSMLDLFDTSVQEYPIILEDCVSWDYTVMSMGYSVGGSKYSTLLALAYRQTLGGCKLVWNDKEQDYWYFMKEISSDGDISTVDVVFPASPFFVLLSPQLLKKLQIPLLAYANNETSTPYDYVFAPHHLGTWPVANIQSNQQENMPIEETGNMLMMILTAAVQQNDVDWFYPRYWNVLQNWGDYLVQNLPDPGNQLCTDDFEGPTPHDANLAVKGIVAIDCFAMLNVLVGRNDSYDKYHNIAIQYANQWMNLANPNDTNHYALRFDQPGWSLKYNLLYQVILGLDTFPKSVFQMEFDFYNTQKLTYGVPLDVRHDYTKLDWQFWVAAMFEDKSDWYDWVDFLYDYANTTPSRVPLSDWYHATTGEQAGFQARTVVGGLYAKLAASAVMTNHTSSIF
eukprot:TRINITY_DN1153_c1_g1_i3.p1 TRINITY_DN1153_c1_g1~~TRINITY_DN1153_c1_g1_i3.p1  ORF type:complete len:726 (-),score=182.07 TRINITY_DN1153_c1_g1_i3:55-2037(-)